MIKNGVQQTREAAKMEKEEHLQTTEEGNVSEQKKHTLRGSKWLLLLATVLIAGGSFAWFCFGWFGEKGNLKLKTGDTTLPEFHMWIYNTGEEIAQDNALTQGWTDIAAEADKGTDPYCIQKVSLPEAAGSAGKYALELPSLQLGKVDNLVLPGNDNYTYMRFTINVEEHGNNEILIHMGVADEQNPIRLYGAQSLTDTEFSQVTDAGVLSAINGKLLETNGGNTRFKLLQYSYLLSEEALAPSDNLLDQNNLLLKSMEFSLPEDFGVDTVLTKENNEKLAGYTSGDYYLYIRIHPNMNTLWHLISNINDYMPCVILTDAVMELDIH